MSPVLKAMKYHAFGLNIESDLALPELATGQPFCKQIDVSIKFVDITDLAIHSTKAILTAEESRVLFQVPDLAYFSIEGGSMIRIAKQQGADEDKVRLYLLGTCMGALLMQRGVLPLHGSAVIINEKAYVIAGESGAGKSTLAAALLQRGYKLVSDDVIAVSFLNGEPHIYSAYAQQKLWEQSLSAFGMNSNNYRPLFERETKYAVPVTEQFTMGHFPLGGIFELTKQEIDGVYLEELHSLEKLRTLFQHTYRKILIKKLNRVDWHFKQSTCIANQVPMFRLQRPLHGFTAHELVERILYTLQMEELK